MEPIRMTEAVEIGDRKFTVQELTVKEILELISGSAFISGPLQKEEGVEDEAKEVKEEPAVNWALFQEFAGIGQDFEKLLKLSCVDFEIKDLMDLAPSSVKKVVEAFKKVNADFLSSIKALGVAEALMEVRDATLNSFSKTLATLSKQGM